MDRRVGFMLGVTLVLAAGWLSAVGIAQEAERELSQTPEPIQAGYSRR